MTYKFILLKWHRNLKSKTSLSPAGDANRLNLLKSKCQGSSASDKSMDQQNHFKELKFQDHYIWPFKLQSWLRPSTTSAHKLDGAPAIFSLLKIMLLLLLLKPKRELYSHGKVRLWRNIGNWPLTALNGEMVRDPTRLLMTEVMLPSYVLKA